MTLLAILSDAVCKAFYLVTTVAAGGNFIFIDMNKVSVSFNFCKFIVNSCKFILYKQFLLSGTIILELLSTKQYMLHHYSKPKDPKLDGWKWMHWSQFCVQDEI